VRAQLRSSPGARSRDPVALGEPDLPAPASSISDAPCDKSTRRANHFGFSEIMSSPGIKNILLSFSRKSPA
jgi:hypothetical protein